MGERLKRHVPKGADLLVTRRRDETPPRTHEGAAPKGRVTPGADGWLG